MKQTLFLLFWVMGIGLSAQAPLNIPYQAVMRNTDGTVMSNSAITITFIVHDDTFAGTIVYQESHSVTTNSQGLVSVQVGGGSVVTGAFSAINWGSGNKFMQVLVDTGSGSVDLGTQQMMSVPYALHAAQTQLRVSATGDSLFIGTSFQIVPGISAANPVSLSNYGSVVLPFNTTCQNSFISISGCDGADSLLYNNQYYSLVEIGGQCWFSENLATTQYKDGSNIPSTTTGAAWGALTTPSYCWYNNNSSLIQSYLGGKMGALYNAYAVATGNLCPTGWHVPSDCEWMYLENTLGLTAVDQSSSGWRGAGVNLAGQLKSTTGWTTPNVGANNLSGFSGIPAGNRMGTASATFSGINNYSYWWTSTSFDAVHFWTRNGAYSENNLDRSYIAKRAGYSVRCLKD
jgi:uncharacterized protein (TIGR02145 family)